jgi:hypothetical protein
MKGLDKGLEASRDPSPGVPCQAEIDAPALVPVLPEGPLHPCGFMPYWQSADSLEKAIYGLSYILQQIQATDTYRPNIGQCNAAASSLEFAIRALSQKEPS